MHQRPDLKGIFTSFSPKDENHNEGPTGTEGQSVVYFFFTVIFYKYKIFEIFKIKHLASV